jgi:2-keto-4-pentenoate hydratase
MRSERTDRAARLIADAWREMRQIDTLPEDARPTSREEAYAIQDRLQELLGFAVAGWKLGATSPDAMRSMGVDEPIPGRLFRHLVFDSPASVPAALYGTPAVEPEFAVRLRAALPPRKSAYTPEEVASVADLFLAIEIANNRIAKTPRDPLDLIADNGGGAGFVVGPEVEDWRKVDFQTMPVQLWIDGRIAAPGLSGTGRIDPIDVAVWTANHLSGRGIGLEAGVFISTGSATAPTPMAAGSEAVAKFGDCGEVTVRFPR